MEVRNKNCEIIVNESNKCYGIKARRAQACNNMDTEMSCINICV